ncbi:IS30 family transposase [Halomonas sp. GDM18]|nr:IS30 family transposase [Halomonas sp. GDM18]
MNSIHHRPPEVDKREMPKEWEGNLIKGDASAVSTFVELSSRYLILIKMHDATATSVIKGFSDILNRMLLATRKTLEYDQEREMASHSDITQDTGVAIYFCDPHSPLKRDSNENINSLILQYFPKGRISH